MNVGINAEAERIIAIDNQHQVIELYQSWLDKPVATTLFDCEIVRAAYDLSKTNEAGFLALREDYNTAPDPVLFFMLITNAFNCQIRFSGTGRYNMPFGRNRHDLNPTLRLRLIDFIDALQAREVEPICGDFEIMTEAVPGDFIYCDPPYLIGHAAYNKHNQSGAWDIDKDAKLMRLLNGLHERGVQWALSNVLRHGELENTPLIAWCQQYHVHPLSITYSNCSYHKIDREAISEEVLITNY